MHNDRDMRLPHALLVALMLTSAAHADVFRLLDDPRDAAQARVDVIQQAEHEIDAVYFLARNDRITLTALALLRDARRRGVESVRLIVDANFQHIPRAVLAHLRDEGVQVRVYHPITLRHPSWLFRRMHEKAVIADSRRYITGGRNLGEAYFGLARHNYLDRDVYVEGASAAEADRHFEQLWASAGVCDLRVRVSDAEKRRAAKVLDNAARTLDGFVQLDTHRDWSAGLKDVARIEFAADPIADDGPRVGTRVAQAIESAHESVVIESPYLVPSAPLLDLLERKLAAGVRVQILTNSLRSTDGALPYAGYLKYRRRLLRDGVDLREYKGPDTLHAKTLVIDGRTVLVGSYNLDPRSESLNAEVMCIATDADVAREVLASVERHVDNAWVVASRERTWLAPRAWRMRAWAARVFVLPLIERQL
jgi:cardiolipin synthase C